MRVSEREPGDVADLQRRAKSERNALQGDRLRDEVVRFNLMRQHHQSDRIAVRREIKRRVHVPRQAIPVRLLGRQWLRIVSLLLLPARVPHVIRIVINYRARALALFRSA